MQEPWNRLAGVYPLEVGKLLPQLPVVTLLSQFFRFIIATIAMSIPTITNVLFGGTYGRRVYDTVARIVELSNRE